MFRRFPDARLLSALLAAFAAVLAFHAGQAPAASPAIPQTLEQMKRLMGRDYRYVDKDELLIVSDLDQKTLYQLMARDFYIYINVLRRDFYDKPRKAGAERLVTVFLFKNRESYIKGLRKIGVDVAAEDENNQGAVRDGYYYSGRERNFILINYRDDYERGVSTYAHELSHALLRREFHNPPAWLNEGIATMIGGSRLVNSHLRHGGGASVARMKKALEKGDIPPLSEILQATGKDYAARENSLRVYDAGELFCLFLHSRHQLRPVYRDLRDTGGKRDTDAEIIRRITGLDRDSLEKAWHSWLRKQK